jgi:ABC-type transporter Mla subunit MlaD
MTDARSGTAKPGADHSLEATLSLVEGHLASLNTALCERNLDAIGQHGHDLQRALTQAVDRFSLAAKQGSVPEALRRRLAHASATVAAQRESLARATAALDRAIDVLMPRPGTGGVYARDGSTERAMTGGVIEI